MIAVGDRKRSELMPKVPTLFEALKLTPEQQWWLDFRADLNEFGRVLVTTPNVPADRLAFLRAAIKKVLTDPELIADAAHWPQWEQPAEHDRAVLAFLRG